mmetsp:Transcript_44454/g.118028  ORF Transcript_44454/g.118028 Transcript_44454/m.118028 type:complete len:218 (-) Transcript_44454:686-1339(-)
MHEASFGLLPSEISNSVPVSIEAVLVDDESLQANRATGVHSVRGDSHLSAETKAKAVGKARGGVVKDTSRIDPLKKSFSDDLVLSDDDVRVMRSMKIDVINSYVRRGYHPNSHGEAQKLFFKVLIRCGLGFVCRQVRDASGVCLEADTLMILQTLGEKRQKLFHHFFMYQQRFHCVARSGILCLGVHDHSDSLLEVRMLIHIHGTDAIRVPKDGNSR